MDVLVWSARTAAAWDTLMKRLGYTRYGAQGNDAGAMVVRELGILAPEGLVGVHLQQIFAFPMRPRTRRAALNPLSAIGVKSPRTPLPDTHHPAEALCNDAKPTPNRRLRRLRLPRRLPEKGV